MKQRMDLVIGDHRLLIQYEDQGGFDENNEFVAKVLSRLLIWAAENGEHGIKLLEHTVRKDERIYP